MLPFIAKAQQVFTAYEQAIAGTNVTIKMMPIQAGSFQIGSPDKEKGHEPDESPVKKVKIDSFWIAAYETTYDQYEFFFDDEKDGAPKPDAITRPSPPYIDFTLGMGKQGGFPANSMSQYAALMYCKWLYKKTGIFFRLPTEAEWEYACRAGTETPYPFGKDTKQLKDYAWFEKNSGEKYHKVGELKPNAWGLYDMLGNVMEWTLDEYKEDYLKIITDNNPSVSPTSFRESKTVKGGSFQDKEVDLRSANRIKSDPIWNRRDPQIPKSKWWNADAPFVGFRIVRPIKQPSAEEIEAFFKKYME
ncbi:MAG: formylglycine-generating enzyme family protein [Saprospiraceae bacterium]|nr:formylglycine-generating enzyme family protein [Saprospiraceae bacterium]